MLKAEDLAWAAGIYEGEGSTAIADFRKGGNLGSLRASVTSTDFDIVDFFAENWGGHVYVREQRPGCMPVSRWTVISRQASLFLIAIQPYVKAARKREIIRIGIAFQAGKSRSPLINRTAEYAARQHRLRDELGALNTPAHNRKE